LSAVGGVCLFENMQIKYHLIPNLSLIRVLPNPQMAPRRNNRTPKDRHIPLQVQRDNRVCKDKPPAMKIRKIRK
jgi:hypothetical protein